MGAPLNNNDPYIKSTGERSTLGAELASGGSTYSLPTAAADTKGGVKIGAGLTMTGEVLSNDNPTPYSLPTAAADTLGGVKVGSGLSIADGVLSATRGDGGFHLYKFSTSNGNFPEGYIISSYDDGSTGSQSDRSVFKTILFNGIAIMTKANTIYKTILSVGTIDSTTASSVKVKGEVLSIENNDIKVEDTVLEPTFSNMSTLTYQRLF